MKHDLVRLGVAEANVGGDGEVNDTPVLQAVRFLYNTWEDVPGRVFVRVRTNPVGEFRNAIVGGNRFLASGRPTSNLVWRITDEDIRAH